LTVRQLDEVGAVTTNFDTINAFNTDNTFNEESGVRLDTLRIEASQGDMDLINVYDLGASGIFLLGEVESSGSSVVTAEFNGQGQGLTMSGFEYLWDAGEDDTYVVNDLTSFVSKLTLIDFVQTEVAGVFTGSLDRDTLKLANGAFESAAIRAPISHTINVTNALHMGDGNTDDLQWLGVNDVALREELAVAEGIVAGSVGFDFQVLDISAVTATATGGSLVNQITAAGSAINADDELVVGNLALLNATTATAITNFDILSLTGAGGSYDLDMTAGQLQTGANVKIVGFTDVETLDVSRTTTGNTITVTGAAANVVGSAFVDTITGGAGADFITGGAGADNLDGGVIPEVLSTLTFALTAGTLGVTTNDGYVEIANGPGNGAIRILENGTVLGSIGGTFAGPDVATITPLTGGIADNASAASIATVISNISLANWNTYLGAISGGALTSVSVTTAAGAAEITFKGNTAAGDLIPTDIVMSITGGTDATGTIQINGVAPAAGDVAATSAGNGVDYSAEGNAKDTFVFEAATDSTVAAMDLISNFNIDAGVALVNDVIDLSALNDAIVDAGGVAIMVGDIDWGVAAAANYAAIVTAATASFAAGNYIYAGATTDDSYLFLDTDQSGTFEQTDAAVKLVGTSFAELAGFDWVTNLAL